MSIVKDWNGCLSGTCLCLKCAVVVESTRINGTKILIDQSVLGRDIVGEIGHNSLVFQHKTGMELKSALNTG